jgi:hypothetical protein
VLGSSIELSGWVAQQLSAMAELSALTPLTAVRHKPRSAVTGVYSGLFVAEFVDAKQLDL